MNEKAQKIREQIEQDSPDTLFADGFDDAIIGIARRCGQPDLIAYSVSKCVDVLVSQGLTHEDATEHFEFNVVGAWVGPHTPTFVYDQEDD